MSRKSDYVGWFGKVNLPQTNNEESVEIRLEDFNYSERRLSFKIVKYTTRNVVVKYTTINYEKHPVEWRKSTKSTTIFKLNKAINPVRFCEIELPSLDIPEEFKLEIIDLLNVVPSWRKNNWTLKATKKK